MEKNVQIILVENNPASQKEIEKNIRESGICNRVKIALNGGHALLYLDHLHLTGKVDNDTVLILLNLNTPVVDGFEFLKDYQASKTFKKENIQIAVIDDNLSDERKAKAASMGISCFLSSTMGPSAISNLIKPDTRSTLTVSHTVPPLKPMKSRSHSKGSTGVAGAR